MRRRASLPPRVEKFCGFWDVFVERTSLKRRTNLRVRRPTKRCLMTENPQSSLDLHFARVGDDGDHGPSREPVSTGARSRRQKRSS